MLRTLYGAISIILLLYIPLSQATAQESGPLDKLTGLTNRLLRQTRAKVNRLNTAIDRQSATYLRQMARREENIRKKLQATDSAGAARLFGNSSAYNSLLLKSEDRNGSEYLPSLDSLKCSLLFLQQHADKLSPAQRSQLNTSLLGISQLETKLQQSAQIKAFLKERQQQVTAFLTNNTAFAKELNTYKEQYYYYSRQLQEYKEILKDPGRQQKKVLSLLNQVPAFKDFMKENSMLSQLFQLPADYGTPVSLEGLQTRAAVQEQVQRFATNGGPNATQLMQQNLQAARGELNKLKDKANLPGGNEVEMPPNFKPNNQKTKTFLQRLEYGANFQTARAGNLFPATTDIGLSVGYKLNDKSVIGIGASYKLGWGSSISHIALSSEGTALRSFLDYKLKGSFYASGGFEYNYQQPFTSVRDIDWQQSGLIGISKIVSLQSRVLKKTSLQLLWDFLSYSQVPRAQPLKFRMGYKF